MGAVTKAELEAMVKRLEKSLERSEAKNATLTKSLDRAKTKNKTLGKSLNDAYEREKATAETLSIIRRSPTDTQPVFEAIVGSCARLFGKANSTLLLIKGERAEYAATTLPPLREGQLRLVIPLDDQSMPSARSMIRRETVHIPDVLAEGWVSPQIRRTARERGFRALIVTPLVCENKVIGAINATRPTPGAFSEQEIALLQTFADQAVIAVENVRRFKELQARNGELTEALEQLTITSEILRIISSSPSDTQPVFDAIAQSGVRLFGEAAVAIALPAGGQVHAVAIAESDPERIEMWKSRFPFPLSRDYIHSSAILDRRLIDIPDARTDPGGWKAGLLNFLASGYRAMTVVPMVRGDTAIGAISVLRRNPGPLSGKQLAMLQTFASQAVIAIENVRLFKELQARNNALTESLEQQTATGEILRVISQSPTDVQPVFDTIAERATRLCESLNGVIFRRDGDRLVLVAHCGPIPLGPIGEFTLPLDRGNVPGRSIIDGQVVHVADLQAASGEFPEGGEVARRTGFRTALGVPLMREGVAIGVIGVRRAEAQPFSDRQIELLKTFADQAVIAIENARLFKELRARNAELTEALEQQTATSEILRVISGSPSDIQPVFDAILENACRLCDAHMGILQLHDGAAFRRAANWGFPPAYAKWVVEEGYKLTPQGAVLQMAETRRPVHILDRRESPGYLRRQPSIVALVELAGVRTFLAVPMLKDDRVVGAITVNRPEVRAFTQKQIDLLTTFADQAVIAIENARLFKELQARNAEITEALEQQTATAEILRVISSSPTDLQPVFDAILESATRLCDANLATLGLYDGEKFEYVAQRGGGDEFSARLFARGRFVPTPQTNLWRMILEQRPIHVRDLVTNEQVRSSVPVMFNQGARSLVAVPMIKEGQVVGGINIYRFEVRPFTQEQVNLVSTFANQAVIAIENVRLFKELQAQTEALSRSVNQLTALGEVGQAISSSLDLETVLKTIVSRALTLTQLDAGSIYEYDPQAQVFRLQATENIEADIIEAVRTSPIQIDDGVVGRIGVTREITQVPDILDRSYQSGRRELLVRAGYRALLAVPLLRDEQLLGVLLVHRKSPGEFAPEVVDLLKTFATQSALAIQNARLFREIAEKGRQLEVASQHKSQFLASMSHELRTPLNAILGFNEMMLDGLYGELPEDLKDPLQETQTSGRHLLRLINNVLDLAKIEAGRMELALADYAVQDMVESVRSTLRPLAEAKGLEFNIVVPSDIPLAYGDAGRLTQCLMNLAGNSLKFTKAGQVAISVAAKGDTLAFRVVDTGIGIAPEKIDSLFTEFKQTDATIASEYGGTGLGLAITRQFVEMHGGRIWVESEPGKGSTFIFEIPLRAQAT